MAAVLARLSSRSHALLGLLGGWELPARCGLATAAAVAGAGGRVLQAQAQRPSQLQQAAPSSSAAHPPAPRVSELIDLHCGGPFGSAQQQASPLRVLDPGFKNFGGVPAFYGQVSTIKCNESNLHVHAAVKEDGAGRVLVIDNGGSMRASVLGDILTNLARKHGWSGLVVNGCIRDAASVCNIPIGLKALGPHPMKPGKGEPGVRDVTVVVGGVAISPGDWLYSDEDGILVSPAPLEFPDAEQMEQLQRHYHSQSDPKYKQQ